MIRCLGKVSRGRLHCISVQEQNAIDDRIGNGSLFYCKPVGPTYQPCIFSSSVVRKYVREERTKDRS